MSDVVTAYQDDVESTGVSSIYLRQLKSDIKLFAETFTGKISEVTAGQIAEFIAGRGVGPRRSNNIRAGIVALFRWCRARKYLPDETTAAEHVGKKIAKTGTVKVFTPENLQKILAVCGTEWQPAIAIQAFAGVRTAEVSRLYWRNIMPEKRLVEIPAAVAKVGKRRLIPMSDNLALFLQGKHDPDDMLVPYEGHQVFIERIIRQKKIQWIKNGLRHAFGSYRCAILKDVAAVAYEMGNSPAMVMRHYHEAQELATALEWFGISPSLIKIEPKSNTKICNIAA